LVGDGPLRESILEEISKAPERERIEFMGSLPQDQLEAEFAKASVLVMASRPRPGDFEGFGMVSAEAAVRGLPTAAYPTDGAIDAVIQGGTGLVSPSLKPADLVATIMETLDRRFGSRRVAEIGESTWGRLRFERQYLAAVEQFTDVRFG
jgi:phosphatidyl-myo-inositol dimannoside synthase